MVEEINNRERFNWRLPIYGAVGASIVLLSLFVYGADASLLHIFVVTPIFCLFCLILLVSAAIRKRPRRCLSILFTVIAFLAVSVALFSEQGTLRPTLRWLFGSHRYKAELVAAPNAAIGALKHIEWDVSGWGPVGPTIVYLVSTRPTHFRQRPRAVNPDVLAAYPAKSLVYSAWRATGTR